MTDDDTKQDTSPKGIPEPDTTRLVAQIRGAMQRLGGRVYRIELVKLDHRSLMNLLRCLRDVERERDAAVRRARTTPWRR